MKLVRKKFLKHLIFLFYRIVFIEISRKICLFNPKIKRPHTIEVELTNYCNLKCKYCFRKEMSRSIGYMDFELFKKLINEISHYPIVFLRIVGLGESSCHPDFAEMIKYACKKGIKIEITTNGELLNRFTYKEILSWNIDILGISVDGNNESSYESVRIGGNYIKLEHNIKGLYNFKTQTRKKYPLITIRRIIMPMDTKKDLHEFISIWKKSSNIITFNTLSTKNNDSYIHDNNIKCKEFYFDAHIRFDGSVLLCPNKFIFDKNDVIGNIKHNDLETIWKSDKLVEIRKLHKTNSYPTYCKSCYNSFNRSTAQKNSRKFNYTNNLLLNIVNRIINVS